MEAVTFRHDEDEEVMTLCNSCQGKKALRISTFGGYTLEENEIIALIALLAEHLREK